MFTRSLTALSIYLVLLLALEVSMKLGWAFSWPPNTLPRRLMESQGVSIGLIAFLGCAQLLRLLPDRHFTAQAGLAVSFTLIVTGIVSAVYFDPILCLLLCAGSAPIWRAANAWLRLRPR